MDLSGRWSDNAHYGMTRDETKKLYKHATEVLGIKMHPLESLEWWNTPTIEEQQEQLQQQMERVTTTPSRQMMTATGVPLHVKNMRMQQNMSMQQNMMMQQNAKDLALEMIDKAIDKVTNKAIEKLSVKAGKVTPIKDILNPLKEDYRKEIRQTIENEIPAKPENPKIYKSQENQKQQQPQSNTTRELNSTSPDTWVYKYKVGGKENFYCVPENFEFPHKLDLKGGFGLWLNGDPSFESVITVNNQEIRKKTPIMPYRMLRGTPGAKLPRALAKKFGASWKVMEVMTEGVCLDPNRQYLGKELDQLYRQGLKKIEDKAEYTFQQQGHMKWTLSTWSRKLHPTEIEKNGTERDKSRLTKKSVPHPKKRKRSPNTAAIPKKTPRVDS